MAPGGPYGMNFSGADGSFPAPFGDGYGVHRVCFIPEILLNFVYWIVLYGFNCPSVISQGLADKGPMYGPRPASWDKPRMARR